MASYSRVNLLEKILILNCSINELQDPALILQSSVYVLLSVRVLAARKLFTCTDISVSRFLQANKRGISRRLLASHLTTLTDAGYISRPPGRVLITEAGKAALNDLETILRTTHVKQRRYQDTTCIAPGRKRSKA